MYEKTAHENSVVFVEAHLASMAEYTGVGTGYSAIKLPCVSGTLRVTPRFIVWRRRHAFSMPLEEVESTDCGRVYELPGSKLELGMSETTVKRQSLLTMREGRIHPKRLRRRSTAAFPRTRNLQSEATSLCCQNEDATTKSYQMAALLAGSGHGACCPQKDLGSVRREAGGYRPLTERVNLGEERGANNRSLR